MLDKLLYRTLKALAIFMIILGVTMIIFAILNLIIISMSLNPHMTLRFLLIVTMISVVFYVVFYNVYKMVD